MEPSNILVGDKVSCINDDFAGIELGLQNVGKDFARGKVRMFPGGHVKAD